MWILKWLKLPLCSIFFVIKEKIFANIPTIKIKKSFMLTVHSQMSRFHLSSIMLIRSTFSQVDVFNYFRNINSILKL